MTIAGRTLTTDVITALTYWPDVIRGGREYPPEPVDLTVLPPFLNGLLADLPWWNHDWRVGHVEPGVPLEIGSDHRGHPAGFTEVSVPGTVGPGDGESLPFVAKVGFAGDQLIRFQAKIDDVVIGPAVAPAGRPEPHPFGRLFAGLMDLRGIPVKRMAWQTERSRSTIWMLRDGMYNPDPPLVREIAEALGLSEADVRVIAGLDVADPREEAP